MTTQINFTSKHLWDAAYRFMKDKSLKEGDKPDIAILKAIDYADTISMRPEDECNKESV